jgi:hypothetical protein
MIKYLIGLSIILTVLFYFSFESKAQTPTTVRSTDLEILDRERANIPPPPKSLPRLQVTEDAQGQPVFDDSIKFTLGSMAIEGGTI